MRANRKRMSDAGLNREAPGGRRTHRKILIWACSWSWSSLSWMCFLTRVGAVLLRFFTSRLGGASAASREVCCRKKINPFDSFHLKSTRLDPLFISICSTQQHDLSFGMLDSALTDDAGILDMFIVAEDIFLLHLIE